MNHINDKEMESLKTIVSLLSIVGKSQRRSQNIKTLSKNLSRSALSIVEYNQSKSCEKSFNSLDDFLVHALRFESDCCYLAEDDFLKTYDHRIKLFSHLFDNNNALFYEYIKYSFLILYIFIRQ